MVFSRFIWIILAHITAIVITSLSLGIYLQRPGYPITISLLIILLAGISVSLFHYLVKIRRDLLKMINALRYEDPSLQFRTDTADPYFSEIHKSFNDIVRNFKLIRLDKEAEHQFFRATADHIQFGIIAFSDNGEIMMVNRSFQELFGLTSPDNISELVKISPELPDFLMKLTHRKEAFRKFYFNNRHHHLIFLASEIRISEHSVTLVSVRDISKEIDKNELEAWQKLIRILKHEILNSVSPIRLLSGNLENTVEALEREPHLEVLSLEEIQNLKTGLRTIHRRAIGLSKFVDAYSNLYQVPDLSLEKTRPEELVGRIFSLFREQFQQEGIHVTVETEDPPESLKMDSRLIEQVLINLIKNAIEAIREKEHPEIRIRSFGKNDNYTILVEDNGTGIPPDQIESIFLPFFTTREEGTGIGLSFAQHVMQLHNGYLNVSSRPGKGSAFSMVFRIEQPTPKVP